MGVIPTPPFGGPPETPAFRNCPPETPGYTGPPESPPFISIPLTPEMPGHPNTLPLPVVIPSSLVMPDRLSSPVTASRPLKLRPKPDIRFVITLLVLSICAPLNTAYAQECEPGALDYIVRDEKGEILDAQALESIRKGMRNPADKVGTLYVSEDGKRYERSYLEEPNKTGQKIPVLSYVDVSYSCKMKVSEATLTYRGITMRLIFNVDIPNKELPYHGLTVDSLPFQEGTFKLDLSGRGDEDWGKGVPARKWKKVRDKR